MQSRHTLPGWYGVGSGLFGYSKDKPERIQKLQAMYQVGCCLFALLLCCFVALLLCCFAAVLLCWFVARVDGTCSGRLKLVGGALLCVQEWPFFRTFLSNVQVRVGGLGFMAAQDWEGGRQESLCFGPKLVQHFCELPPSSWSFSWCHLSPPLPPDVALQGLHGDRSRIRSSLPVGSPLRNVKREKRWRPLCLPADGCGHCRGGGRVRNCGGWGLTRLGAGTASPRVLCTTS